MKNENWSVSASGMVTDDDAQEVAMPLGATAEQVKERAQLIAAAPELLTALNALIGAVYLDFEAGRYVTSPDQEAMAALIETARAAVLKASGRAS